MLRSFMLINNSRKFTTNFIIISLTLSCHIFSFYVTSSLKHTTCLRNKKNSSLITRTTSNKGRIKLKSQCTFNFLSPFENLYRILNILTNIKVNNNIHWNQFQLIWNSREFTLTYSAIPNGTHYLCI